MHLRRARPEDLAAVGEATVAAYASFVAGRNDPYLDKLRDAGARDREAELWVAVAEDDRTVLGSVTLCPDGSSWREVARGDEGEFRMLAVDPAAQGQGVGLALVEHCLDHFREQGAPAVVISSLTEMSAAHRLYGRLGFERLPDRDWSPLPGVDLICFERVLA
ncbi:GNAT family N-acetyltransferase [Nocardioides anomalus]|uniref:GNAT family N-acetyltransferase n=1 Tax=Nocardioides anomalus TaxID=2712223 RepID=UPI001E515EB0|nr:GNAT family N-acetyltransferase [Nocardioides anomalus]